MKTITKTYTTSGSIGLTDAQLAGLYAVNITYNLGASKYYAGTFFANTTSGGYTTFGSSGFATIQTSNSGYSAPYTGTISLVSSVTSVTAIYYYFE